MKASSLKRKAYVVDGTSDDDPRPLQYRHWKGYNAYVTNLTTAYCLSSGKDLAFRYLCPKANLQSAALDHAYTELPFTHYWIDRSNEVRLISV